MASAKEEGSSMNLLTSDTFGLNELRELVEQPEAVSVSIYVRMERLGPDTQGNPTRLKNQLQEAERQLIQEIRVRAPDARTFLERAAPVLQDYEFWQHQSNGLAFFIGQDFMRYYRVPLNFRDRVVVNRRFHVKPLLPLLMGDGRFYVLALSRSDVRLLQGTRNTVTQIYLPEDVPQSLAQALRYEDNVPEGEGNWRGGAQGFVDHSEAGGRNAQGSYHGQGVTDKDDIKEQIWRFFKKVDKGLIDLLATEKAPMVLAGVEYLHPIYHDANSYKNLMDEGI